MNLISPTTYIARYPWLQDALRRLTSQMREMMVLSLFINLLALAVPVFVLQVYDRVVFKAGMTTLQGLLIGVLLAVIFDFLLKQARSRYVQSIGVTLGSTLAKRLYERLAHLPLRKLERMSRADWQTAHQDVQVIRDTIGGPALTLALDLPFVFIFFGMIWFIAPPLGPVVLVILPLFAITAWYAARIVGHATNEERIMAQTRDKLVQEMVAGRETMKALGMGDTMRNGWEHTESGLMDSSIKRARLNDMFGSIGGSLGLLTTIAMTSIGALAILQQEMTIGALIASNMLVSRIIMPLNQLINTWRQLTRMRVAIERLDDLLQETIDRQESSLERPRPAGELSLSKVNFTYDGGRAPAISDISLSIKPGRITGLIGHNGSGKTTLSKLLQGLYQPDDGTIRLDGADLSQFSRPQLRRWIGYVPQEPFLFDGSIRDNLIGGLSGLTDDDILKAAAMSGADDLIKTLPDGYGTRVGEAGRNLTPGQRQLIAVTRALVADPPILILDEPTAHLDMETLAKLRLTLIRLSRDHTIILITHARAMLDACSEIIVLQQGKITAQGPTRDVLQARPAGRQMPATPADAKPEAGE